jgi:hypothetical protein
MSDRPGVEVGSLWRRNPPYREEVLVQRVWEADGETLVRAHPIQGGRPLVASAEDLAERYTEVPR